MDENELKDLRFCLIHQLPKKFRFSYKRTLLKNGHSARCEAAESKCHSARSEVAESLLYQNITTIPLNRAHELNFQPDF